MRVHLKRDLRSGLDRGNQFGRLIRKQKSGHILDTDGISSHLLDALCHGYPVIQGVGVAQGVGKRDLNVTAFLTGSIDRCLKVTKVVQTVENTDNVNTVGDGLLNEVLNYVVGIVTISQDVLAAEQHLQLRVFETGTKLTETLPRIFLQETKAGIKGRAAPALYCMVADPVHFIDDREHLLRGHTCSDQGLVRITQHGLHDLNRLFLNFFCHFFILLLIKTFRR